jgi:small nuclear ribonucleoprotein (snRNP)-like protein
VLVHVVSSQAPNSLRSATSVFTSASAPGTGTDRRRRFPATGLQPEESQPDATPRLLPLFISSGSPPANSCLRRPPPSAPTGPRTCAVSSSRQCRARPVLSRPRRRTPSRRACTAGSVSFRARAAGFVPAGGRLLPATSSSLATCCQALSAPTPSQAARLDPTGSVRPSGRPTPRYSHSCASPTSVVPTPTHSMASPPLYMSFPSPVTPVTVRALLHNGQLIWGMFVSFDPVWNPILQDCVEIHPQAGRHVPGPLVFPCAAIASLAVEPESSLSLPSASIGAPSLALSAHTVPSPPPPPPPTTDWVVDSGASFHTTPTTSSLLHSHPPHPSHPSSIVVGNGSTLPVTSVGASVLPGPFCLNDVESRLEGG